MNNPYQAPKTREWGSPARDADLNVATSGQKLIIYSILLYFLVVALRAAAGPLAILLAIPLAVMAWVGIYKIGSGLGYPVWLRVFHMLCMFIPLVGLLVLLVLSSRTTARLKKAGYTVGLLGARA